MSLPRKVNLGVKKPQNRVFSTVFGLTHKCPARSPERHEHWNHP